MNTSIHFRQLMGVLVCSLALGACTTTPVKPAPTPMGEMLSKAGAAAGSGQKEAAMTLWREAAAAYPADKEPWLRMAQSKYEGGQYGEAIIDAQEVLVRDPADKVANSIVAISGLRLSTRALADLSRQNNLSGPLRVESQDLAKLLRESLGETVLVPVKSSYVAPAKVGRGKNARSGNRPAADNGSANPFEGLK
ncbi:hypothetical protein [Janthinobacterium sp.]|uniref:tetratricopeptide repeat protein n=1 Tax=Janthinobacterium sp. TaxID=1871054 RepID=UPI00293D9EE1|nr:hypothetical protein [Janthinobacterium sp.]